ncbi:MAG: folate family ECF transporter S component [Oscillospiraceae bacterium]|nr:folate family ECF transporter S component [Oscillospiraceae bacterium]
MKGFFNLFVRSAKELKSVRNLCVIAMLIALDLVLKLTISIKISNYMTISFAFIAMAAIGMLYGPTVGFTAGMITDILGYIIKPDGAFDIRFTLIEALGGLLYGLFLYNAKNDKWLIVRIVSAKATVIVICNLLLTNWAISALYGSGFMAILPARIIKNLAQFPVDVILLSIFLPLVLKAYNSAFKGARTIDENLIFSDENFIHGMTYVVCLLILLIGCTGIVAQYLKNKNDDQSDLIEAQQEEIDYLYDILEIEKPVSAE